MIGLVADPALMPSASASTGCFEEDDDGEDSIASLRKRRWLINAALALMALAVAGVAYYWMHRRAAAPSYSYKSAAVTRGDIIQSVTANGQIKAVKMVTVGSQVSGIITDIKVDYNSRVTNGQIVAQIDPSSYQQLLIQAEADLANAQAALKLADVTFTRARELRASQLVSQASYDESDANLAQAQAVVKTREASLNNAKVNLERTIIYSPIDGVVISRAVDVGQTVAANFSAPTLFTVANDLRDMRIEAAVSEADVGGVEAGQTVKFTVDAFPGRTFAGGVTQVRYEPVTSQNVVTYVAVVDVRNDDLKLRPGMTANATIITSQRSNVLRVPNAALRFRPAGAAQTSSKMVYLARTGGVSTSLQPVQVKTGISDNSWTEIPAGVQEGDMVATGLSTGESATPSKTAATTGNSPFGGGMPPPPPH